MDKPVLSPDFIHKKQQRIFCVQARTEEYAAGAACGLRGEQGRMLLPYSITRRRRGRARSVDSV